MMRIRSLLAFSVLFVLASCGTDSNVKPDSPMTLKKGASHFLIDLAEVNLTLGDGAIPGDKTFVSQDVLKSEFEKSFRDHFIEKKILAENENQADAIAEIKINYLRKFNWGGKALNKPEIAYTVTIKKDGKTIASWSEARITTSYGYLKDTAINLQIAAFKWGAEDEIKDVDKIAEFITADIAKIGK